MGSHAPNLGSFCTSLWPSSHTFYFSGLVFNIGVYRGGAQHQHIIAGNNFWWRNSEVTSDPTRGPDLTHTAPPLTCWLTQFSANGSSPARQARSHWPISSDDVVNKRKRNLSSPTIGPMSVVRKTTKTTASAVISTPLLLLALLTKYNLHTCVCQVTRRR